MREPKLELKGKYYRVRYYKDAFARDRSEAWFTTKEKAETFINELTDTKDQKNQNIKNKDVRVGELFNTFKETTKNDMKITSRAVVYNNLDRYFVKKNKYYPVKEIVKIENLTKIKNEIFELGLSDGVISALFGYISRMFLIGADADYLTDKDARLVKRVFKPVKNHNRNKRKQEFHWTKEQTRYFLNCLFQEHTIWYVFFYFQVCLGLRQSELSGLCLKHIDTNRKMITIEQQAINDTEKHRLVISSLKTESSYRVIRVNDEFNEIMKEYIRTIRITDPERYFFFNGVRPLSKNRINYTFARYREKYGMPYASIHTLRHNAITYLLEQPNLSTEELGEIAKRFGHSVEMMVNTYMRIHENKSDKIVNFNIFDEPKKVAN